MGTAGMTTPEEILANEITVFKDRIRMQTRTPGLDFHAAWKRRVTMQYQQQSFYVVSLQDLIASKKAAGRPVDLEDVRLLEIGKDRTPEA